MVVGSKAEYELFGMTREEVEKELLKMPAQKRFREFNKHLAKTEAEWAAMEKRNKATPKTAAITKPQAPANKAAKGK